MARTLTDHIGELLKASEDAYATAMVVANEQEGHLIFATDPDLQSTIANLVAGGATVYGFIASWPEDDGLNVACRTFDDYRDNPAIEEYMQQMMAEFRKIVWPHASPNWERAQAERAALCKILHPETPSGR